MDHNIEMLTKLKFLVYKNNFLFLTKIQYPKLLTVVTHLFLLTPL